MTATELIHYLQQLKPDTKIIIRGYEGGYNDILKFEERKIVAHPHQSEWYYGEYDDVRDDSDMSSIVKAVELWGENTKCKPK